MANCINAVANQTFKGLSKVTYNFCRAYRFCSRSYKPIIESIDNNSLLVKPPTALSNFTRTSSSHNRRVHRRKKTHHKLQEQNEKVLPLAVELFKKKNDDFHIKNDSDIDLKDLTESYLASSIECDVHMDEKAEGNTRSVYGSPDSSVPISRVPCPGCGAHLHCQDDGIPGYIPSQRFVTKTEKELRKSFCQRCIMMKRYNLALGVSVHPEEYEKIIRSIKAEPGLAVVVVDVMDITNSIYPNLMKLIGEEKPLYIIGNKLDLLPRDDDGYLERTKAALVQACKVAGLQTKSRLQHVALVSAKSGYGIEELVTKLMTHWGRNGPVYIIGSANCGKSTLFNALLSSDYCKASARDFIHRATTCIWPGTTLSLLRFPIINPSGWRLHKREERLRRQRSEDEEMERMRRNEASSGKLSYAHLIGNVGQTFKTIDSVSGNLDEDFGDDDLATYTFKQGLHETEVDREEIPEPDLKEELYKESRWCFDTPGLINPQQIINVLTQDELSVMLANKLVQPRTFIIHPGQTMFVTGLGRIDYLEGPADTWLTVFTSNRLPVHVMWSQLADDFYKEHVGTDTLGLPLGDASRLAQLAPLEGPEVEVLGRGAKHSGGDLILSSLGWVAVATKEDEASVFRIQTPGGCGAQVRTPALLPYAVRNRGKRIRNSAAYQIAHPVLGHERHQPTPARSLPLHMKYGIA